VQTSAENCRVLLSVACRCIEIVSKEYFKKMLDYDQKPRTLDPDRDLDRHQNLIFPGVTPSLQKNYIRIS